MITAAQAKQLTKEAITTTYKEQETKYVFALIRQVALNGKSTVNSNETDPIVADRLRNAGYTVNLVLARDQRDSNYITINWD